MIYHDNLKSTKNDYNELQADHDEALKYIDELEEEVLQKKRILKSYEQQTKTTTITFDEYLKNIASVLPEEVIVANRKKSGEKWHQRRIEFSNRE